MSDGQADWADSMDVVMLQEKIKTLRKKLAEKDKELKETQSKLERAEERDKTFRVMLKPHYSDWRINEELETIKRIGNE